MFGTSAKAVPILWKIYFNDVVCLMIPGSPEGLFGPTGEVKI
jgi:hypothetical protein